LPYKNPFLLIIFGVLLILVSFFFLDRYAPGPGLVWNAINGRVWGVPYRWVVATGAGVILLGLGIAVSKRQ